MRLRITIEDVDGTVLQSDYTSVSLQQYEAFERRLNGWNPANWLVQMCRPFVTTLLTEE